jgi:hypothetical protein
MLNVGYIEGTLDESFVVRIYYDTTFTPVGNGQPLINGPRGWCLDVTNTSGRNKRVVVTGVTAATIDATVGQGDPVTNGQGRSRTAAQLASVGFTTRGDVANFQVG